MFEFKQIDTTKEGCKATGMDQTAKFIILS